MNYCIFILHIWRSIYKSGPNPSLPLSLVVSMHSLLVASINTFITWLAAHNQIIYFSVVIIIQRKDDHSNVKYEQLLETQSVKLTSRSGLQLYIQSRFDITKCKIRLKVWNDVKLEVNIKTGQDVDVDKTFDDINLNDNEEAIKTLSVLLKTRKIAVELSGFVKLIHWTKAGDDGKQFVQFSKIFTINQIEESNNFGSFYLNKCQNNDYIVSPLIENGEAIPNILSDVYMQHHYFKKVLEYKLKTE